jgi:hypothetical protein
MRVPGVSSLGQSAIRGFSHARTHADSSAPGRIALRDLPDPAPAPCPHRPESSDGILYAPHRRAGRAAAPDATGAGSIRELRETDCGRPASSSLLPRTSRRNDHRCELWRGRTLARWHMSASDIAPSIRKSRDDRRRSQRRRKRTTRPTPFNALRFDERLSVAAPVVGRRPRSGNSRRRRGFRCLGTARPAGMDRAASYG